MSVVSITTPSYGRHKLLERQHHIVLAQSEQDFEWLILDDSPEASPYFLHLGDPRIRYHHHAGGRMSIGAKRNWLAERAESPVIAHFDDDDYYAPDYLKRMLERLSHDSADLINFSAWYLYSLRHKQLAYWDTSIITGLHYRMGEESVTPGTIDEEFGKLFRNNYAGFGQTYVYRKSVWQDIRFPDTNFKEDYGFAGAAIAAGCRFVHSSENEGLFMKIMRADGLSVVWPQWLLPAFLLPRLFPVAALELLVP